MALLTGRTEDGQEVPVQVKPDGRLVAEGLTGPTGAPGPAGPPGLPGVNSYLAARLSGSLDVSSYRDVVFDEVLGDPYGLYNRTTGVFTVNQATAGVYMISAGLNASYLNSPSGESTLIGAIVRNNSVNLQYQELWETTNPDETVTGMSLFTIAQLTNAGDNVKVRAHLITSSGVKNLYSNSSLLIMRVF